jgi:hypothetical protein
MRSRERQFIVVAFALTGAVALVDALTGHRSILIMLLLVGSTCAALSLRRDATIAVGVLALVLAVWLGGPDGIWATTRHALFVGAIALDTIANAIIVSIASGTPKADRERVDLRRGLG